MGKITGGASQIVVQSVITFLIGMAFPVHYGFMDIFVVIIAAFIVSVISTAFSI
jgi:ABC-type lipoprotein release transport system permease subunit